MVFGIILILIGITLVGIGIWVVIKANAKVTSKPVGPQHQSVQTVVDIEDKVKGNEFEKYILDLFQIKTHPRTELVEWQGDKISNGVYPLSNRNPDLLFKYNLKNGESRYVAVECKYRQAFVNNILEWTSQEKIDIYKQYAIDRNASVFVALGVGGSPSDPQDLYLVPLSHMNEPVVVRPNLTPYRAKYTHGFMWYDDTHDMLVILPPRK